MKQIETSLDNNGLLFIEFSAEVNEVATYIVILIGMIELMSGVLLFFYDE